MMKPNYMERSRAFPTVLVAEDDEELRSRLVDSLRQEGYLVLEAHDRASALRVAELHSRPIHLLLVDASIDGPTLAATLKQYRDEMRVLFVTERAKVSLDDLLTKVRDVLEPPRWTSPTSPP